MSITLPSIENNRVPAKRPVLGYFVLVSLVLHALVATLWQGEPPAGPVARSTFEITVLARHGDVPDTSGRGAGKTHASPSPAERATTIEGKRQRPLPATTHTTRLQRNTQAAQLSHRPDPEPPVVPAEPASPAVPVFDTELTPRRLSARHGSSSHGQHELTSAARYRRVRAALHEALLPRFQYPSIARRRGWQGSVTIGLHVAADGGLTRIHLLESSGYALLDKAAVKNVSELRNVPGATQWLGANGMEVVLPVRYQLHQR